MQKATTILIPVYNGEKYLRQAIDSALAQTYSDLEVIVIDDGSTDGSGVITNSYGNKIRYFSQANRGVSSALNLGIKKAKGQYISWLSHDDVYAPNKIATQMEVADDHTICFSNYQIIDENSQIIETPAIHLVYDITKFSNHLYPVVKGLVFGCTLLIPKKCFEEQGLFDESLKTAQDYDMWLRLFPKYQLRFQPEYLLYSRRHPGQGSHSPQSLLESNSFWIKLIDTLSDQDKIDIDGSLDRFHYFLYRQLDRVGYTQAARYALSKVKGSTVPLALNYSLEPLISKIRRITAKLG